MEELISEIFTPIFLAILKVFLVAAFAGLLVRIKWITQENVNTLSKVTINVFLPCLIFSKVIQTFDPVAMPFWWTLPLAGMAMNFFGLGLAWLFFFKETPQKNNMIALASLQNVAYLVLPVVEVAYPENFDLMAVYIFLLVLAINPVLWSVGKMLMSHQKIVFSFRSFLTPPFLINIVAILVVLVRLDTYIPALVNESITLLGEATIPVVTFVLGATLGSISLTKWPTFKDSFRVMSVKFLFIPVFTLLALKLFAINESEPLLADLFMIQAAAAPATALILQVRSYGGDLQQTGSLVLISYGLCLFAIPGWVAVLHFFF